MKIKILLALLVFAGIILAASFVFAKIEADNDGDGLSDYEEQKVYTTNINNQDSDQDSYTDSLEIFYGYSPIQKNAVKLNKVTLDLPYINESPDGSWTGPWKNACEEASIAMVEHFYLGKRQAVIKESMAFMTTLFTKQNQIWGSNADSDANRTAKLINDFTSYNASIKDEPTIEEIKKELQQKRPVIAPVYGKTLANPNTPFLASGSYYHMIVIVGYDDTTKEFICHDNGDAKTGTNYRYAYDVLMDSLHDFDFTLRKANGPARVLFTYPKLAKLTYSPKVYYLKDNTKQWVVDEKTFNAKGFSWDAINVVQPEWLINLENGIDLKIN